MLILNDLVLIYFDTNTEIKNLHQTYDSYYDNHLYKCGKKIDEQYFLGRNVGFHFVPFYKTFYPWALTILSIINSLFYNPSWMPMIFKVPFIIFNYFFSSMETRMTKHTKVLKNINVNLIRVSYKIFVLIFKFLAN
jgi:hypothetical protein